MPWLLLALLGPCLAMADPDYRRCMQINPLGLRACLISNPKTRVTQYNLEDFLANVTLSGSLSFQRGATSVNVSLVQAGTTQEYPIFRVNRSPTDFSIESKAFSLSINGDTGNKYTVISTGNGTFKLKAPSVDESHSYNIAVTLEDDLREPFADLRKRFEIPDKLKVSDVFVTNISSSVLNSFTYLADFGTSSKPWESREIYVSELSSSLLPFLNISYTGVEYWKAALNDEPEEYEYSMTRTSFFKCINQNTGAADEYTLIFNKGHVVTLKLSEVPEMYEAILTVPTASWSATVVIERQNGTTKIKVYENNQFINWTEGKLLLELEPMDPWSDSSEEDIFAAESEWGNYKVHHHDSARLTHLFKQALSALPEVLDVESVWDGGLAALVDPTFVKMVSEWIAARSEIFEENGISFLPSNQTSS